MTPPPSDAPNERDLYIKIRDDYKQSTLEVRKELSSVGKHVAALDTRVAVVESNMSSNKYDELSHSMNELTKQLSSQRNTSSAIRRPSGMDWVAKVDWVKFFKGLALFIFFIVALILGKNLPRDMFTK